MSAAGRSETSRSPSLSIAKPEPAPVRAPPSRPSVLRAVITVALAVAETSIAPAAGHGLLTCPRPRQYRGELSPYVWTEWVGITVPGDLSFNGGQINSANLNAGIGGGTVHPYIPANNLNPRLLFEYYILHRVSPLSAGFRHTRSTRRHTAPTSEV